MVAEASVRSVGREGLAMPCTPTLSGIRITREQVADIAAPHSR